MTKKRKNPLASTILLCLISSALTAILMQPLRTIQPTQTGVAVIQLDPNLKYQSMTGWEATDFNGNIDLPEFGIYGFNPLVMQKYKDVLADLAVNDLGLNRVRLEVFSGAENPTDSYTPYINGQTPRTEWKKDRNRPTNDNDDPNRIDFSHFQFSHLDHEVDTVVLPLKQQLAAKGETLYINLTYVDFDDSPFEHRDYPEEYAEFILATFLHLQNKYGWTPDAVEVNLEPNNAHWNPTQVGNALVAAAQRLQANGYTPDFIAPSHAFLDLGLPFFDEMVQSVPGVLDYLTEFSYHCYNGCQDDANLRGVAERGAHYQILTSHLEHIGHTYLDLHRDLKLANVSAWAEYTLAGPYGGDEGGDYFFVDISDQNNPVVSMQRRTKFLRQYILFVKRGATRIEATSNDSAFDPLAFINRDGRYVVVVKANHGGSFSVQDLPPGTYGIKYTTDVNCNGVDPLAYNIDWPDVTIGAGEAVNTSIPACGVLTVYGKTAAQPQPTPTVPPIAPATVTISGPTVGALNSVYNFTATVNPLMITQPITYVWHSDNQTPLTMTEGTTATVSWQWATSGVQTMMVTATNPVGSVSNRHVIVISPAAGALQFNASNYSVSEGSAQAMLVVNRVGGTEGRVTVNYTTSDLTAVAGLDYTPVSGTLTFADQEQRQTLRVPLRVMYINGAPACVQEAANTDPVVHTGAYNISGPLDNTLETETLLLPGSQSSITGTVPITDDRQSEGDETFNVQLSNPTGGAILGSFDTVVVTIVDNDTYYCHLPLITRQK